MVILAVAEMSVDPKPEEQLVDAILDEALADFKGLVTPSVLAAIRGCLEDRLTAHPDGRALLRRAMPDPAVHVSGDVATGDAEAKSEPEAGAR